MSPWIVPLDGGPPTQIVETASFSVDVSTDGRLLVHSRNDRGALVAVVCDLPACTNRRDLALPENAPREVGQIRFMPDGRAIAYPAGRGKNLWSLPLDGGPPTQLTHFSDAPSTPSIARFAWSRDGKLAMTRTTVAQDIVLFRGLPE
jgi:hypothetical protein